MKTNNTYIILSSKTWNAELATTLKASFPKDTWILIDNKQDFTEEHLNTIKPKYIFIPHWSHIIPKSIYTNFKCIVFHMTDLPYGRGGSPLQNLIVRGHKDTKISAINVVKDIDAGQVYLKAPLSLQGTAQEIFIRANAVIETMIKTIITQQPIAQPQQGDIVAFKRRTPEMSNLSKLDAIDTCYDYIRMLDADGYPKAYIETEHFKIEFCNAKKNNNGTLDAHVTLIKK